MNAVIGISRVGKSLILSYLTRSSALRLNAKNDIWGRKDTANSVEVTSFERKPFL